VNIKIIFGIYILTSLARYLYVLCTGFLYRTSHLEDLDYWPLVSIVIPAWNEHVNVKKAAISVLLNTYRNVEVVLVNDGSTDNTSSIIESLVQTYPDKIRFINQSRSGKAAALNNGILHSQGEIIITMDADSYIARRSIENIVRTMADPKYDAAIGRILIGNTNNLYSFIQFFEYAQSFHVRASQHLHNSLYIFPGALTAVRKQIFEDVGYFEGYSKTEDLDISMKVRANGKKVAYVEDAVCYTEGASNIEGLINQRTRWRHGFLQCMIHRKDFVFSKRKGIYLTFVEVPCSLIVLVDIFLYPLIMLYLAIELVLTQQFIGFLAFYLIMPYSLFLVVNKDSLRPCNCNKYLLLLPVLFHIINVIEHIALFKAFYRLFAGHETKWTNWVRAGL